MSLTHDLHNLLEGTGIGEMNILIFAAAIGVVLSALIHKPLTMRMRVTLVTLAAITFGVAFVVEDQILQSRASLLIAPVIGAGVVVLLCAAVAFFAIKLTGKMERMPVIAASALVIVAALNVLAYATYLYMPLGSQMRAIAYYSWLYSRDMAALCCIALLIACVIGVVQQVRRNTATINETPDRGHAEPVNLTGGNSPWQKPGA